jgi:hypothetical protein
MGIRKYTDDQKNTAIQMRLSGCSRPEISAATGVKDQTLKVWLKEAGVRLTDDQTAVVRRKASDKRAHDVSDGTKPCPGCDRVLPLERFSKDKNRRAGISPRCLDCLAQYYADHRDEIKAERALYRAANLDLIARRDADRYARNPQPIIDRSAKWNKDNQERHNEIHRASQRKHQGRHNAESALYRARKRHAMPQWLTAEDKRQIAELYRKCPKGYHVDHIIPLHATDPETGEHVACGLHVPWNLQILHGSENCAKSSNLAKFLLPGSFSFMV